MTTQQAYRKVRTAIRRGELVRPSNCVRCGKEDRPGSDGRSTIQAHHADYSRPLDVEWICSACHRLETPLPLGGGGISRGTQQGNAKLTEAGVAEMRMLRVAGSSYNSLAHRYGVSKKAVILACTGRAWTHVPMPPELTRSPQTVGGGFTCLMDGKCMHCPCPQACNERYGRPTGAGASTTQPIPLVDDGRGA